MVHACVNRVPVSHKPYAMSCDNRQASADCQVAYKAQCNSTHAFMLLKLFLLQAYAPLPLLLTKCPNYTLMHLCSALLVLHNS